MADASKPEIAENQKRLSERYVKNSIDLSSDHGKDMLARIGKCAKENGVAVALGLSEKVVSKSSADGKDKLYIGQILIDAEGEVLVTRRKLRPFGMERLQFRDGEAKDLDNVVEICLKASTNADNSNGITASHKAMVGMLSCAVSNRCPQASSIPLRSAHFMSPGTRESSPSLQYFLAKRTNPHRSLAVPRASRRRPSPLRTVHRCRLGHVASIRQTVSDVRLAKYKHDHLCVRYQRERHRGASYTGFQCSGRRQRADLCSRWKAADAGSAADGRRDGCGGVGAGLVREGEEEWQLSR